MSKCRLLFEKRDRAKYLSHLDLMRVFPRVFQRGAVPVWHTEGFNPHAFVSIALPLPLGQESRCELLDFELLDEAVSLEELPGVLNPFFPSGIRVLEAYEPKRKFKELTYLKCRTVLEYDQGPPKEAAAKISEIFALEEIIVPKKSKKKGIVDADIRSLIVSADIAASDQNTLTLECVLSAQNPGLNPDYLLAAISKYRLELQPDFAKSERVGVYDSEMRTFR